jgi:hypothetical protein
MAENSMNGFLDPENVGIETRINSLSVLSRKLGVKNLHYGIYYIDIDWIHYDLATLCSAGGAICDPTRGAGACGSIEYRL